MNHEVVWKDTRSKEKEKLEMRKEIVQEIQESCDCESCPKIKRYLKNFIEKQEKKHGRHCECRTKKVL